MKIFSIFITQSYIFKKPLIKFNSAIRQYLDIKYLRGEEKKKKEKKKEKEKEAIWELHKDTAYRFEQILKTAAVQTLTSHLTKMSKTYWVLLEKLR